MTISLCAGLGKSSGAFAFALNFLLLFLSKRKSKKKLHQGKKNIKASREKVRHTLIETDLKA